MQRDPNDQISNSKDSREAGTEDTDLQQDDHDDEIIELVDPIEEGDSESTEVPLSEEAEGEVSEEEREFSLEELESDVEVSTEEPDFDATIEPLENGEEYETKVLGDGESRIEEILAEEEGIIDSSVAEADESGVKEDQITDEVLAELFSSHETEVAEVFQEVTETGDVSYDVVAEEQPVSDEQLPDHLFADFETESEPPTQETHIAEPPSATEEELPEGLFAALEVELDNEADKAVAMEEPLATEEEVPEELFVDLEDEPQAPVASPVEIGTGEVIAPAVEELAALLSAQVEEVVTRLVEERLPSIVERTIADQIEKIRTTLESGQ
jgi:hypothetical protein